MRTIRETKLDKASCVWWRRTIVSLASLSVVTDNVVEIASRLRDGHAVKTAEDFRQRVYEYLDSFSKEIGQDQTPIDVFPVWTRVMIEGVSAIIGNCGHRGHRQKRDRFKESWCC